MVYLVITGVLKFISNLCISPLILLKGIVSSKGLTDIGNYRSYYEVTDKNNNTNFEGLDIRLAMILVIMSVSTFINAVILYCYMYFTDRTNRSAEICGCFNSSSVSCFIGCQVQTFCTRSCW